MRTRVLAAVIAVGMSALLVGCSASGSTQADAGTGAVAQGDVAAGAPELSAPAPDSAVQGAAGVADAGSTAVSTDRQIVKNAYVAMRVETVSKAVFAVHGLIKKNSGLISSEETQSSDETASSMITAQIPAARLDAFLTDVTALGTVDSVTVNAQDVTGQTVDLDARIKALRTSVDRMTQLLAQAQKIDDMLAIETQLSQRQAELDSLTAQRTMLGEQVALSTVTLAISPNSTPTAVEAPGFLSGLASGWAALVSVVTIMFTAAGFLMPFALIALLVLVPLTIVLVRQARRRRSAPAPTSAPADDDDRSSTLTPV